MARTQRASRAKAARAHEPGLREKQKARRFARIRLAARELFLNNEYERTTLRAIAKQARVGAGTILRYVPDKRALLLLLFDEDHKSVSDRAAAELSDGKAFLQQSIDGFRHYYEYFGAYPEYARAILREFELLQSMEGRNPGPCRRRSVDRPYQANGRDRPQQRGDHD